MTPISVLVIANPAAKHLRVLEQLPEPVNIMVGNDPEFLRTHAPDADVILNANPDGVQLPIAFSAARRVRWVHAMSAGVDKILFPELIASDVTLTNGRGVFKDSLAEFAIASILHFAKGLRRLVRSQEAGRWEQFDIALIRGQTLGIVGYGEIGRETARLAHALGMKVAATRRKAWAATEPLLERMYPLDRLHEMLGASDYVLAATPLTMQTRGMLGEAEFQAMKDSSVIINVGRGPVIVETALIRALEENWIQGAALDVFDQEPLPEDHAFYRLPNVLLSPHSADHTAGWAELAMQKFVENFERFRDGQPLQNVVDKRAGY